MAKMIDFALVTRGFLPFNAKDINAELKAKYIDNGWELFNTHFMRQVGEEIHMNFVFVKYEPEPVAVYAPQITWTDNAVVGGPDYVETATTDAEAPRKRGRPKKVEVA